MQGYVDSRSGSKRWKKLSQLPTVGRRALSGTCGWIDSIGGISKAGDIMSMQPSGPVVYIWQPGGWDEVVF
jgi:hypothetical protein